MIDFDNLSTDDGFYETSIENLKGVNFENIPEDIVLNIYLEKSTECFISREGKLLVVQVEKNVRECKIENLLENKNQILHFIKRSKRTDFLFPEEDFDCYQESLIIRWTYRQLISTCWQALIDNLNFSNSILNNSVKMHI